MEWPQHPMSISESAILVVEAHGSAVESGHIIALLRGGSVHVTSLANLENPAQIISLGPAFAAFGLSYSPYGVAIRDVVRDERMEIVRILLLSGKLAPSLPSSRAASSNAVPPVLASCTTSALASPPNDVVASPPAIEEPEVLEEPESGSGLTPPASPTPFARQPIPPTRASSLLGATAPQSHAVLSRMPFSTAIAETLVIGPNGIQSLSPTPTVLKLERLCAASKMDEATAVVDDERRRGRRGEVDADKATHQATLRLLHLYLGVSLLREGMFTRAGDYLTRGKIDPRLVVRLFPALKGKTIGWAEEVEVFKGLKSILEDMPDIDQISEY